MKKNTVELKQKNNLPETECFGCAGRKVKSEKLETFSFLSANNENGYDCATVGIFCTYALWTLRSG